MSDLEFSEWRGEGVLKYRELISGTIECGDFYCESCGCCLHCNGDCCESRGEAPCWAVQYADDAAVKGET